MDLESRPGWCRSHSPGRLTPHGSSCVSTRGDPFGTVLYTAVPRPNVNTCRRSHHLVKILGFFGPVNFTVAKFSKSGVVDRREIWPWMSVPSFVVIACVLTKPSQNWQHKNNNNRSSDLGPETKIFHKLYISKKYIQYQQCSFNICEFVVDVTSLLFMTSQRVKQNQFGVLTQTELGLLLHDNSPVCSWIYQSAALWHPHTS